MADKSWALQQGYNLQLQELHICRQAKSRRKKKTTTKKKAAKRHLDTSMNTSLGLFSFILSP